MCVTVVCCVTVTCCVVCIVFCVHWVVLCKLCWVELCNSTRIQVLVCAPLLAVCLIRDWIRRSWATKDLKTAKNQEVILVPSTTHSLLLVDTGSCPVQPQSSTGGHWELPQYNHSLLLVDTGSCPVQPQSSTGGHWELPSTTTVFYWWTLGAASTTTVFSWWTLGAAQYNQSSTSDGHWELPSTTTVFYWWTLGAAQYNQSSTSDGHWELPSTTSVTLVKSSSIKIRIDPPKGTCCVSPTGPPSAGAPCSELNTLPPWTHTHKNTHTHTHTHCLVQIIMYLCCFSQRVNQSDRQPDRQSVYTCPPGRLCTPSCGAGCPGLTACCGSSSELSSGSAPPPAEPKRERERESDGETLISGSLLVRERVMERPWWEAGCWGRETEILVRGRFLGRERERPWWEAGCWGERERPWWEAGCWGERERPWWEAGCWGERFLPGSTASVPPQSAWGLETAAHETPQKNRTRLRKDTGSCPVQPQSSTVLAHWVWMRHSPGSHWVWDGRGNRSG